MIINYKLEYILGFKKRELFREDYKFQSKHILIARNPKKNNEKNSKKRHLNNQNLSYMFILPAYILYQNPMQNAYQ